MKTTVEISEQLLKRAKQRAAADGTTLRSIFEEALQRLLDEREQVSTGYVLPDVSVGGRGLRVEFDPWHWDKIGDLAYDDREGLRR